MYLQLQKVMVGGRTFFSNGEQLMIQFDMECYTFFFNTYFLRSRSICSEQYWYTTSPTWIFFSSRDEVTVSSTGWIWLNWRLNSLILFVGVGLGMSSTSVSACLMWKRKRASQKESLLFTRWFPWSLSVRCARNRPRPSNRQIAAVAAAVGIAAGGAAGAAGTGRCCSRFDSCCSAACRDRAGRWHRRRGNLK